MRSRADAFEVVPKENEEENEQVLDWALKNLNLKLVDIDIQIKNSQKGFNENFDKSINKSIRILPSKETEGFFIAKLVKFEK